MVHHPPILFHGESAVAHQRSTHVAVGPGICQGKPKRFQTTHPRGISHVDHHPLTLFPIQTLSLLINDHDSGT